MSQLNWQKIYLDYSPKLLGICRRYIADIQNAEDIVQDSFITAIQKNYQLKDEKAVFAWLKKIVVNNALQCIRKTGKENFITTETSEIPDISTEMITSAADEKQILAYDFTRDELLKSIDNLPSHHKSVFNLYYLENYSHAEISALLEIPVNTSKSHLMRAKKSVQNYLLKNFVSRETPKNKMAQLLIFLGFGSLLWAQTFQSKFSDFTIAPSQNFQIPSDIVVNHHIIGSDKSFQKKVIIAATFFVIIVGSVLLFSPQKSFSKKENSYKAANPVVKVATEAKPETKSQKSLLQEKNIVNDNQKKTEKRLTENEKSISSAGNIKAAAVKDSAEAAPQKVIIVKKIIQRDTIFIERQN